MTSEELDDWRNEVQAFAADHPGWNEADAETHVVLSALLEWWVIGAVGVDDEEAVGRLASLAKVFFCSESPVLATYIDEPDRLFVEAFKTAGLDVEGFMRLVRQETFLFLTT